jgi:hypothetical protein
MVKEVFATLADANVLDLKGNNYRLGNSWAAQPVILVFIRHFG